MGKSTISMVIFHGYVSLPEGKWVIDGETNRFTGHPSPPCQGSDEYLITSGQVQRGQGADPELDEKIQSKPLEIVT